MLISRKLSICFIIISLLSLTACGLIDIITEASPEPVIEAPLTLESAPEPTPEPPSEATSTPAPILTQTPEPPPEITPEPDDVRFKFPFNFSSVDLYGNTITDEDLGEKELFFAYLWAVW